MADSYWKKRQDQLNRKLEEDEARLKKRLALYYKQEAADLGKQIAAYYAKYGEDNVIRLSDMMKDLSDEDKQLLYRDINEFIQKYPQYQDLVPTATSIYKLNRLEGLQYSIQLQQMKIGAEEQDLISKHLEQTAKRNFQAVQEAIGAGDTFNIEDNNVIKTILENKWSDGKNYSDRIWNNKEKLTQYLNQDLAHGFARGDRYDDLSKKLQERFTSVSRRDAFRLIYTEGSYVMNESQARSAEKTFDYYHIVTQDEDACDLCKSVEAEQQSNPVLFKDRITGVNFPPFHPWCRCNYQIVVPDEDKWIHEHFLKNHPGGVTQEEKKEASDILKIYVQHVKK